MSRKTRYTATFIDGEVITRTSHREYAAAWRGTVTKELAEGGQRVHKVYGFARTATLAVRAARRETGFFSGHVVTEIAPAVAEGGAA